jgi:F0F1-type ATP synthase assembly protein I
MSFVAGPLIGYFMDEWLQTSPWCLVGFTLLGAAAGFRRLFSLLPKDDGDGGTST